jgi:sugar O-acyltransferase (sialic acid O-acetyltransferase NeuD family)
VDREHRVSDGVVVFGGGGHGRTLLDLLAVHPSLHAAAVVDDGLDVREVLGVPVHGGDALGALRANGLELAVNAVGGIGVERAASRAAVFDRLAAEGFRCPALVHPSAVIDASASVADGVQVLAFGYVGAGSTVGFGTLLNTGAVVSHDCVIGERVNLSPGALLAGEVVVEDGALIGMGATVNIGVRVGRDALVGNSAGVKADVPAGTVVWAGTIWPRRPA